MSARRLAPILVAIGLAAAPAPADAAAKFTPKVIAGTYDGTWTNQTFGISGTFKVTIKSKTHNTKMTIGASVGGTGFGCPSVPAVPTFTLKHGKGANHWSSGGFRIKASGPYGRLDVTYAYGSKKLTGSGTAPPSCAPGVTYKLDGKLAKGVLDGTATINLGSQTATTIFHAQKQ